MQALAKSMDDITKADIERSLDTFAKMGEGGGGILGGILGASGLHPSAMAQSLKNALPPLHEFDLTAKQMVTYFAPDGTVMQGFRGFATTMDLLAKTAPQFNTQMTSVGSTLLRVFDSSSPERLMCSTSPRLCRSSATPGSKTSKR